MLHRLEANGYDVFLSGHDTILVREVALVGPRGPHLLKWVNATQCTGCGPWGKGGMPYVYDREKASLCKFCSITAHNS